MKFENTEVFNFESAIRGMRNPLESWGKSDSGYGCYDGEKPFCKGCNSETNFYCKCKQFVIGDNDLELMQKLIKAGSEHRKFMRQIMVSVDITAPLYWWKEFDTYKIGTVANSTSTMHKLASTEITLDCFEMGDFQNLKYEGEDWTCTTKEFWESLIDHLEALRQKYLETKDKRHWKELIRLLPESWLQKRTVTMNYENLLSIVHQRQNHKLTEWGIDFIDWVKSLPYADKLICLD